jgi:hypothetical protein
MNGEKYMETNSHSSSDSYNNLEAQLRECFGRVVYSHKTQEKCADIVFALHKRIKFWQIFLSAVTTTSFFTKILGNSDWGLYIGAVTSTLLFALNTYTKDYDLGEIAQKHTSAANDLWDIRESYLSLITDLKSRLLTIEEIVVKRDEYQDKLSMTYSGSPRTNSKAYKLASEALQKKEELTFRDEEIDAFLPKQLRKNQEKN